MEDRISGRQAGAWGFCAMSVPAVLTCAGLGWGWVLLGCAAVACYLYISGTLSNGAVDLTALTQEAFGKTLGRALLALGGAFCLLAAAQTAGRASMAFPDQTKALAAPAVVLLAALSNRKGAQQAARACGALFLLLAGLYAVILLAALKNVEVRWMTPWGGARQTVRVIPAMLSLGSLRYLPGRQERTKGGWLGALTVLPAALAAVTAGCLSARLTQQLELPFYTVSQSLSVLGVMERLEPLVSAALLMGFFALESLLFAAARAQLERAAPAVFGTPWAIWALGALTLGLRFAAGRIGENVWALGAAVCWGILPLLTQLIVAIK